MIGSVAMPEQLVSSRVHDLYLQLKFPLHDRLYRDRAATPIPAPGRPPAQGRPQPPPRTIAVVILNERSSLFDIASISDNEIGLLSGRSLSEPPGHELGLYVLHDLRLPDPQVSRISACAPGVGSV